LLSVSSMTEILSSPGKPQTKNNPYLPMVDGMISPEIQAQRELAAHYIECVEDLLEACRDNCQVPDSILKQSAAKRYDNISTYEKKLTFRMFQLLSADLRELIELLGRNATKYSDHKRLGDQIAFKFESLDPKYFGSKAFIEKTEHIQQTFREVWLRAPQYPDQLKDTKKSNVSISPQKTVKDNYQSPQKGGQDSAKKNYLKHGAGFESARKTDKDALNLRDSSKEGKVRPKIGIEAILPQRKKKLGNTTITVVSKHNPKADVTQAFRWRPEESLLKIKLNKEKVQLDQEYEEIENKIRIREEAERRMREEEARKSNKNRVGSKGRRPKDDYLTTSSDTGNIDGKLDESLDSLRNRAAQKNLSKATGLQQISEGEEGEIKIEGSSMNQRKSSVNAIPPAMNKELKAEEIEEKTLENFKSLEFDFKFRRTVLSNPRCSQISRTERKRWLSHRPGVRIGVQSKRTRDSSAGSETIFQR
jgi:hypothetical protein